MEKIETIFDYNPTEEELDEFFASQEAIEEEPDSELLLDSFACRTREGYLKDMFEEIPGFKEDAARDMIKRDLSKLFEYRKDMESAYKYAHQITDPEYRQSRLNMLGGF
ncbi:MAG: hypothetical protein LBP25_04505 [Tannerellaceae bacterium]|jgi:hypothetical protein|nr:hypothetical protein [Tannerellaceae bacterium]